MLKCRDVAEQGSHFLDRKIPWYKLPGWYLHLFLCGNCRRFVRQLRTAIKVAAGLPRKPAKQETVSAIMESLPTGSAKESKTSFHE